MFSFDMTIPASVYIDTEAEANEWAEYFHRVGISGVTLGLDTETTGLDKQKDHVVVWSISDGVHRLCVPVRFLPNFRYVLEEPRIDFAFTNVKFDTHMLANEGIDLTKAGKWKCTVVQTWLLNENSNRKGLKECILDVFRRATPTFTDTFGKITKQKVDKKTGALVGETMADVLIRHFSNPQLRTKAADYASLDAYNTKKLCDYREAELAAVNMGQMSLLEYFNDIETEFSKTLYRCERRGITLDQGFFKELEGPMLKEMEEISAEFVRGATLLTGSPVVFNIASGPQISWFFYTVLQKPVTKWTKGGTSGKKSPCTDSEVIEAWAEDGCQWARKLIRYRDLAKNYSTYVTSLQDYLDRNFRIHTNLNHTGTVTGRLSSSGPNLQNIPAGDKYSLRSGFISGFRKVLIVADYEQVEMRLMAHLANDLKMIDAINTGIDLHCFTVSQMHKIPYEEVIAAKKAEGKVKDGLLDKLTDRQVWLLNQRKAAKRVGFGIIYGIGGGKLAHDLSIELNEELSREDGDRLIEQWLDVFPAIRQYIDDSQYYMAKDGYVQTLLGRFRRFGDVKNMQRKDRSRANRQAVNATVQGSAADIAKLAMILIDNDAELKEYGAELLLQVHDELIVECDDIPEVVVKAKARVKYLMENALGVPLRVPITCSIHSGYTWAEAK